MGTATNARRTLEEEYERGRAGSRELWTRARDILPQGVSGAAKWYEPYPVFLREAQGAHVVDVDGNTYVDLLMGAGPMLLGHGHPRVLDAVREQLPRMTNPMAPTELGVELAERIRGHMPYLERMRFVNTGSEATRSAVRVARAATGRNRVAKCEGNFHGSDELFLVSTHSHDLAGPAERPEPVVDYAGMASGLEEDVVLIPYNQPQAAVDIIDAHGDELAAVIMEPVAFSSGGGVPATKEFAGVVREATARHGIPLIFDEVLSAYRLGLRGAPAYLDVTPDLATIGKAVGGGMPLGAFGGKEELMLAALAGPRSQRVFQSGTFTENPLSMVAGLAVLDVLESEPTIERADAAGRALRAGLAFELAQAGVDGAVTGAGSIFQIHLGIGEVTSRRDILRSDSEATRRFLLGMVAHGVLWPPVHPAVTSGAHDEADVQAVLEAARAVLATMYGE